VSNSELAQEAREIDALAVDRFKSGDKVAFEELMVRYEGKIYGYLSRMCNCADNVRDVLQETFLTTYRYLGRFRGESSFKTWLYKIASTSCLRSMRRRKNEPAYHLSYEDLLPGEAEKKEGLSAGWYNAPVADLLNKELHGQISKSLEKLPEKYRAVFILREMEELNAEETARALGISSGAVKSRLHRARLFLRKELAAYYLKSGTAKTSKA
jgi:RNA polymerase sigma-70 factor (ECF subfamily)